MSIDPTDTGRCRALHVLATAVGQLRANDLETLSDLVEEIERRRHLKAIRVLLPREPDAFVDSPRFIVGLDAEAIC